MSCDSANDLPAPPFSRPELDHPPGDPPHDEATQTEGHDHDAPEGDVVPCIEGGFQVIAGHLGRQFKIEISRQRVCNWWRRRKSTKFPEGFERPSANGTVRRFRLDEVIDWYKENRFMMDFGKREKAEAKPSPSLTSAP